MYAQQAVYLRQNVQVEPLVDSWYAWSHLIPPCTLAKNITERHLAIIDSYISAPELHARAVKNPKMLGGPFIDYSYSRVDEIRVLRSKIIEERHQLLALSQALVELDSLLRHEALGHSLTPLYARIPRVLRGYTELVYDLNNHPSFRIIEPLVYRSELYQKKQQSLMLSITQDDDRPFILSTPRLPTPDSLALQLTFDDALVDYLFCLKTSPQPLSTVLQTLPVSLADQALFESFLTTEAPRAYVPFSGPGLRWRYFGHACILIESQHFNVLVDPVLSYTYDSQISRYTYLDLPDRLDFVLITHNHQDHVLFETLLQLRHKIGTIMVPRNNNGKLQDPSLKLSLEFSGFHNVIELTELEELVTGPNKITALPFLGEHSDLDIGSKLAWLITIGEHKVLFAADSCNIDPLLYSHLAKTIGSIDCLFLGMECDGAPLTWLYGPLLSQRLDKAYDASRRLSGSNYYQAIEMINSLACKQVYVYAMGQEPWLNYIMSIKYTSESQPIMDSNRLIAECKARGIIAERLFGEKEILLT